MLRILNLKLRTELELQIRKIPSKISIGTMNQGRFLNWLNKWYTSNDIYYTRFKWGEDHRFIWVKSYNHISIDSFIDNNYLIISQFNCF